MSFLEELKKLIIETVIENFELEPKKEKDDHVKKVKVRSVIQDKSIEPLVVEATDKQIVAENRKEDKSAIVEEAKPPKYEITVALRELNSFIVKNQYRETDKEKLLSTISLFVPESVRKQVYNSPLQWINPDKLELVKKALIEAFKYGV